MTCSTIRKPLRRRVRLGPVLGLALVLLPHLAAPVRAQEAEPQPVDPAAAAVREALQAAGEGDLDSAIAGLEAFWEREGDAPSFVLATLGALHLEAERPERALELLAPLAAGENADPAVLYNAGRAAFALERFSEAIEYLQRSVDLEPGTPAARELGLLHGTLGRYEDAYRLLRPWLRNRPDDEEARLAAALCAIQLRRLPEAEQLLSGLSQSDPATGLLWGRLLLLKGEPHAAIGMLQPLLEEAPDEVAVDLRRTLAEAHLQVGESEQAVGLLEGRVEGNPRDSLLLARALNQGGDVEGALETLRPFAESVLEAGIDPENPNLSLAADVTRAYGRWLASAGRHEEALPYLRLAVDAEPEEKGAWQTLAQALAATGAREEAQEALARFQEISRQEGSETAQVNRARLEREDPTGAVIQRAGELLGQERAEEALEVLRAERRLNPDDPRPWLLESRVLLILDRTDEALTAAEQAIRLAPQSPDSHYQRGTVHLARKDLAAAEADLRRALELSPDHVPALNDLAVLLIVQGERDEGRRLLERVLELRPDDPRATQTLERLNGRS